MSRFRSVRSALTLWYSLVLLLALLVFISVTYFYLQALLQRSLDADLAAELDWIHSRMPATHAETAERVSALPEDTCLAIDDHLRKLEANYIVVVSTTLGTILYNSDRVATEPLQRLATIPGRKQYAWVVLERGARVRIAWASKGLMRVHVGFSERWIQRVLHHTLLVFGVLTPLALSVSIVGGWILSGVVLRPLGRIADQANRITAERLNERIPEREVDDELGRLIRSFNVMVGRLQSSFDEMKQFSANAAHELKTPLTILKGEAEMSLADAESTDEGRHLATTVLEETARISHIVDDLLTLARVEAGRSSIQEQTLRVDRLIEDLVDDATVLALPKNVRVELRGNAPMTLRADAARMRQLLRILVANAVTYTDPGGTVRIAATEKGDQLEISVADDGIGIAAQDLDRIFDRFYRAPEARARNERGSGLGLSIARWIVESHGGSISVASQPGHGSTFTVRLPKR